MNQNTESQNKVPVKIGLVDWILIMMACISIALGAIYFILK